MFRLRLFCWFLLVFLSTKLGAQDPVTISLDYSAGLPSNTVYNIIQDSKGYIWLGHEKGLSRYNGQSLQHYSGKMPQSRGLSNLKEDNKGRIWCQNFSGETYYTQDGDLIRNEKIRSIGNHVPFDIYQGTKVITTRNTKLIQYDIESEETTIISGPGESFVTTNVLAEEDEIYAISQNSKKIHCYKSFKPLWAVNIPDGVSPYIMVRNKGKLFVFPRIGTENYMVVERGKVIENASLGISTIIQNATIIDDKIWISTTQGAYCYDLDFNLLNNGSPYFKDCNVSKIISDLENSIWISTLNKGVLIIPNINVQQYNTGLTGLTTASYFNSINKLIVGTGTNQIFELHPFTLASKLLRDLKIKNDVIHLYNDIANDRIWVSSDKLYALKGATNELEHEMTLPMKDIAYLDKGYYALASPEGISLFKIQPDTQDQYFANLFTRKNIPWIRGKQLLPGTEGRAKSVAYDGINSVLYASNYRGLFSWSKEGKKTVYRYKEKEIYASSILIKGITAYVGTYRGLLFVIEKGKIVKCIDAFKGLEDKSITKVEAAGDYLWLLFENALVRYNIFTNKYSVFTVADGLPNTEIKDIAAGNNMVYLATRNGLVYFSADLAKSSSIPRLFIEEVNVNHKLARQRDGRYDLRTNENNLEVKLSVISFRNNASIRIYYSINNREWQILNSADRILNLVGLAPGSYEVKLKAVTMDGREIPAAEMLKFTIASPMYTRWWFILIVLLLISAMVFYFMRFRLYELRKEAEFKVAREKLERELQISTLASIKSQMNPHFVFNALNTVQSYIFTNDRDNATDYLNKFSELTRMILDMSNKEKVSLSEEIKALTLYLELEKRRFEDSIDYQIIVNEEISPDMVQIPSMLIQPYVENAIKHALLHKKGDRKLKIEFVKEDNVVVVFVDDNGIGRKKSQELKAMKPNSHRSFASDANKKRLKLLNQNRENTIDIEYLDKVDSYGNSLGTMVILAIPLNF